MVSTSAVAFGVLVLFGLGLLALAAQSLRGLNEPGINPYGTFLTVLGAGAVLGGASGLALGPDGGSVVRTWLFVGTVSLMAAAVPWTVFTLQYTGRTTEPSRRLLAAIALPAVVAVPPYWVRSTTLAASVGETVLVASQILVPLGLLGVFGLLCIGIYHLFQTTYEYSHHSVLGGAALVIGAVLPWATLYAVSIIIANGGNAVAVSIYAGGYGLSLLAFVAAQRRYDVFESTPAVGSIGKRAIARETDDLVIVVDRRDRVIEVNATTVDQLERDRRTVLGEPVSALLEVSMDAVREADTLALQTTAGKRQFDVQRTPLTDQHGRSLGSLVSLRDITDREIREQRLEVLNRVLRHNLRNDMSVITGRMQFVQDALTDEELAEHLGSAREIAEELSDLGGKAKQIEELMETEQDRAVVIGLQTLLDRVVEAATAEWPDARIETEVGRNVSIEIHADRLEYVLWVLVENALEHAGRDDQRVQIAATSTTDDAVYPLTIEVRDRGPGIPKHEVSVLEKGQETDLEHGSGLGLWSANWLVQTLGGELAFDSRDGGGTTVSVRLPAEPLAKGETDGTDASE